MVGQQFGKRYSATGADLLDDIECERRRTLTLRDLRPFALIGQSSSLFPWERRRVDPSKYRNKGVREFYQRQNESIDILEGVDALLDTGMPASLIEEYGDDIGEENPRQRSAQPQSLNPARITSQTNADDLEAATADNAVFAETSPKVVRFWVNVNMFANIVLLVGKFVVYMLTDSLSIVASLVDSVLDLLSTIIIWLSSTFADQRDQTTKMYFPVGRYRLEPIGVLVFSVVIIVSFVQIARDALDSLLFSPSTDPVSIGGPSLMVMVGTVVVKAVLYELCRHVRSSSVQALSQDALTDCIFNVVSAVFPIAGHWLGVWQFDPLGALLLALYVVFSWGRTAMEHVDNLTGAAASPEQRQQLLYLCIRFSDRIKSITSLQAYHAGDRLMCEVDVLLDPTLSMRDAHDLAEALQYALETLPIVERAFVHIDYRRDNFSGHVV